MIVSLLAQKNQSVIKKTQSSNVSSIGQDAKELCHLKIKNPIPVFPNWLFSFLRRNNL